MTGLMRRWLAWLLLPLGLAACDAEEPIGIGEQLLPGEPVRTFVVTLEAADYLQLDTAFAIYSSFERPNFNIIAHRYEGVLESHLLARFNIPSVISVIDTLGVTRTDSTPAYLRGELVLVPDTLATDAASGMTVALHHLAEPWDPEVATWALRQEGVPWTVPGGTPGAEISTTTYSRGDSLLLQVDSVSLAVWADSADQTRGARISMLDGPARIRAGQAVLRVFVRSRFNPDTTFMVIASAPQQRFIFDPPRDTIAGDVRYNGVPTWRTFLQFRPNLRDRTVPCGEGCTMPLVDAVISRAELLLEPRTPPAGFTPELPTSPVAYTALVTPQVPLERTPLGTAVGTTPAPLTVASFRDGAPPVQVVVTGFIQQLVQDTTTDGSTGRTDWLMLVAGAPHTFGFGHFLAGPRLRLVLSTAREVQLP